MSDKTEEGNAQLRLFAGLVSLPLPRQYYFEAVCTILSCFIAFAEAILPSCFQAVCTIMYKLYCYSGTHNVHCTLVCFKNQLFREKLRPYPHACLQGVYNSNPKAFFPGTSLKGPSTLVKNGGLLEFRFPLGQLSAWPSEG